jgi:hypothetical protein
MPLEDIGLVPDRQHRMTIRDIFDGNKDLIEHAAKLLSRQQCYSLKISQRNVRGMCELRMFSKNLSRIDVYVNGRPNRSLNTRPDGLRIRIGPVQGAIEDIILKGFDGSRIVLVKKVTLDGSFCK